MVFVGLSVAPRRDDGGVRFACLDLSHPSLRPRPACDRDHPPACPDRSSASYVDLRDRDLNAGNSRRSHPSAQP